MQDLSWKWVGIGAVIITVLNQASSFLLAEPIGFPLMESMGLLGGLLVFVLIIAVLSYFVGGVIVGRLSPGVTTREPGVASLVAIAINLVITTIMTGKFPGMLGLFIAAGLGYGLGFLGGKVGEAWQDRARPKLAFGDPGAPGDPGASDGPKVPPVI